MTHIYRSPVTRFAAAALVVASLAGGGYLLLPSAPSIAQGPATRNAPPAEALNQANTLSYAFLNSAEKVLPAVVSIRNEVQPRMAKAERGEPRSRGDRQQLPKGFSDQLPRGFDLDPLLK